MAAAEQRGCDRESKMNNKNQTCIHVGEKKLIVVKICPPVIVHFLLLKSHLY